MEKKCVICKKVIVGEKAHKVTANTYLCDSDYYNSYDMKDTIIEEKEAQEALEESEEENDNGFDCWD